MSDLTNHDLNAAIDPLLLPLAIRAIETGRPDALIKDEKAVALIQQIDCDFSRFKQARVNKGVQVAIILRNRQFDRYAQHFLSRHPEAVVVHIGCGLDARFERVDNGKVVWYDLDLPDIIALRRKLIGDEAERYHLLACSVLDKEWLNEVLGDRAIDHPQRTFLFLAEGVFMFFEEAQVKSLVLTLMEHFPGAELVFDAFSPFFLWANNRRVNRTKIGALCHWALKRGQDLESWSEGIRLLDEWFPYASLEPRLAPIRWVRHFPLVARTTGIFHYRLGNPAW